MVRSWIIHLLLVPCIFANLQFARRSAPMQGMHPEDFLGKSLDYETPDPVRTAPYLVSLQWFEPRTSPNLRHFCSGVLLNPTTILTSVHCSIHWRYGAIVVVAGMYNTSLNWTEERTRQFRLVTVSLTEDDDEDSPYNPDWEQGLAIMKVHSPFDFNEYVSSVPLPTSPDHSSTQECTLKGWSAGPFWNSTGPIMEVQTKLQTDKCWWMHPERGLHCAEAVSDMEQAKLCNFDTGAPLMCNGTVVGFHWSSMECFFQLRPDVHAPITLTSVDYNMPWILDALDETQVRAVPNDVHFVVPDKNEDGPLLMERPDQMFPGVQARRPRAIRSVPHQKSPFKGGFFGVPIPGL